MSAFANAIVRLAPSLALFEEDSLKSVLAMGSGRLGSATNAERTGRKRASKRAGFMVALSFSGRRGCTFEG